MEHNMDEILNNLPKQNIEPSVFSLLVMSDKGEELYVGVHYSLEEAFSKAKGSEGTKTLELWNKIPLKQLFTDATRLGTLSIESTPTGMGKEVDKILQLLNGIGEIKEGKVQVMKIVNGVSTPSTLDEIKQTLTKKSYPQKNEVKVVPPAEAPNPFVKNNNKNSLLMGLINRGDVEEMNDSKYDILSKQEKELVKDRIHQKNKKNSKS